MSETVRGELLTRIATRLIASDYDKRHAYEIADLVMPIFSTFEEDVDHLDVTALGEQPGTRLLWQRSIIAKAVIESREMVAKHQEAR
jgi:hypothetical protein